MRRLLFTTFGAIAVVSLIFLAAGIAIYSQIPTDKEIKGCLTTKMYKVYLCPGSRSYVPLNSISRYMQKSVILTEDSSFYTHKGFNWEEIEKSAKKNIKESKLSRGGSTITQQLAKNMFLSKEKSFVRKFFEAIITVKIEKVLRKHEILERYLNVVEFGKNIYGIKAAAQFYFQKHPSELDLVESAFLAMLLPNPVKYSKSYYKKELTPFARKRITKIVNDLYNYNRISQEEYSVAQNQIDSFFAAPTINVDSSPQSETEEQTTIEELEALEQQE